MKVSDYVASFIQKLGIKVIFGYQGGAITHLIESFDKTEGLDYIQNYNEQASALAADAYSRISDIRLGAAIATNGPGATNLVTGIANAYCDSVAVIYITGQVHTFAQKKRPEIRQESFQEIDIISIVKPITKYAVTINNKDDICYELEKAEYYAITGRKGPVLVDIPVDVQGEQIDIENVKHFEKEEYEKIESDEEQLGSVCNKLKKAKRPIIIVGGGIWQSKCNKLFNETVQRLQIPVVASLQGIDVISHSSEFFYGFIGSYGNRYANLAVSNADFILVLGSRLDMRQTGKRKDLLGKNAYVVHVDIDHTELKHHIEEDVSINMDLPLFLAYVNKDWKNEAHNCSAWNNLISIWKKRFPSDQAGQMKLYPNICMENIGKIVKDHASICCDVGQNQMWAAQSLRCEGEDIRILNSGGLGTMGYALPAAIGAYYADRKKKIICLVGDGGLQMNIQELCVIKTHHLPIKIFVFNNYALGLIREVHEKYYNKNYVGSRNGFSQPDMDMLANAYELKYIKITCADDIMDYEKNIDDDKAYLFDCIFPYDTYVRPELLGNDGLDNQMPRLSDAEKKVIDKEIENVY